MERSLVGQLSSKVGETVVVMGWVHRIRALKAVSFVILRDRSGLVQCVVENKLMASLNLQNECVVKVTGNLVESKNDLQAVEIHALSVEVMSQVVEEIPIAINKTDLEVNLDTLLNHRVLGLRHNKQKAIFTIQSRIVEAFSAFLRKSGFIQVHTPKIVKEGGEGGSNVFTLDYFGEKAYLAQSPQFYKQMMVIAGFERVFEIGSVFRAESHSTRRHTNEYVSLDLEVGFIENEKDLMALETALLRHIFAHISETCEKELSVLNQVLSQVPDTIPVMKLSEGIELLKSKYGKIELDGDLDPESERLISAHVKAETGSDFLFLTHYPQKKRPMYTKPCGEKETHSFDLLYKGLEITTGGMRIDDYHQLIKSMVKKGCTPEAFESYLEAFKYGVPPHGGLAIGLERLTAQMLGCENIRETSLFPRDGQRLTP